MGHEQARHAVRAVALGDGAEVEHHPRPLEAHILTSLRPGQADVLHADQSSEAVYLMVVGHLLVFESEAPRVDQRSHSDVEGAVALLVDLLRQLIDLQEVVTERGPLALVDEGDGRLRVEHRELLVNGLQCLLYLLLQIVIALVGDMIGRAKDASLVVLVGHGLLSSHDDHRADDKEGKEGQLPKQFFLFHNSKLRLNVAPIRLLPLRPNPGI